MIAHGWKLSPRIHSQGRVWKRSGIMLFPCNLLSANNFNVVMGRIAETVIETMNVCAYKEWIQGIALKITTWCVFLTAYIFGRKERGITSTKGKQISQVTYFSCLVLASFFGLQEGGKARSGYCWQNTHTTLNHPLSDCPPY